MFSEGFMRGEPPANLDIGLVLGGGFAALGRHLPTFFVLGVLLNGLPFALTQRFGGHAHNPSQLLPVLMGNLLMGSPRSFLLLPLFNALVASIMWADAGRADSSLGSAFGAIEPQLIWILLANVAISFVAGFGLILLLVPGIMAVMAFWVTIPACAVEKLSPAAAISRSLYLTRGQRWRLLGVFVVIYVIALVVNIMVGLISMMAGFSFAGFPGWAGIAVKAVIIGITGAFSVACNASAYVELRTAKEGVGASDIAAVFA